ANILIKDFDLSAAESANGFLGIFLQENLKLSAGTNSGPYLSQATQQSSAGPDFVAGSTQTYTVSVDAPRDAAQTATLKVAGAPASDFELDTSTGLKSLNSDGTFSVTIAAGQTSASFSLVNTVDAGTNTSLQLSATLPDPADSSETISGGALTQNYTEPTDNPFTHPASGSLYDEGAEVTSGGMSYELYGNSSTGAAVGAVGSGNDYIDIQNAINASISGGTGNDSIFATFGSYSSTSTVDGGTDVISGDGGSDIIHLPGLSSGPGSNPPPAAVRVYADSAVDLNTAIANANSGLATGKQGDLIAAGVAATIVGGEGNDLIFADANNDVVVAGPGNETISGGLTGVNEDYAQNIGQDGFLAELPAGESWSASYSQGAVNYTGLTVIGDYNDSIPAGYKGTVDGNNNPAWAYNSTIFGGSGNDVILLSNGNNDVELGTGNSTVFGGMGSDTIIGGKGTESVHGGGGSDYITAGDGKSY